jgi:probable FeS assembly SUF system protein SufT
MSTMHEPIILERACEASLIPSGEPITLTAGTMVYVTQALGGSYTVYIDGNLARIEGKDGDALGLEKLPEAEILPATTDGSVTEEQVWEQLRTIYDPEIPINIVDLGLVYDCAITVLPEGGNHVYVKMTLTAPGCGMGQFLVDDAKSKLGRIPYVTEADVDLVFEPPWDREMMSEAAKLEAGLY